MNELISVIIPAYNVEKYIDRCMETVVGQTYKNLEIILVDDGATDSTPALCDNWAKKDSRINVIHKDNGGLSNARNVGLEHATGDYIAFIDSDDWIELDMYEYLLNLIKSYGVEVAFCDFVRKKSKSKISNKREQVVIRKDRDLDRYFYRIDGGKSSYAVWCGLYKADAIKGIKFIEKEINEDVLFRYEVYKNVRSIVFSNQCKYNYFVNSEGITMGSLSKKDFSLFRIWDYIVEQEMDGSNYEWAKLNRIRATYTLYVKGLISGNKDVEKEILSCWKDEIKDNYSVLFNSNMLDVKRKIILFLLVKL